MSPYRTAPLAVVPPPPRRGRLRAWGHHLRRRAVAALARWRRSEWDIYTVHCGACDVWLCAGILPAARSTARKACPGCNAHAARVRWSHRQGPPASGVQFYPDRLDAAVFRLLDTFPPALPRPGKGKTRRL